MRYALKNNMENKSVTQTVTVKERKFQMATPSFCIRMGSPLRKTLNSILTETVARKSPRLKFRTTKKYREAA